MNRLVLLFLVLTSSLHLYNCLPTQRERSVEKKGELLRLLRLLDQKLDNSEVEPIPERKIFVRNPDTGNGSSVVRSDSESCFNPCGGDTPVQLADYKGTIYSPGYDEKVYPNSADCRWLIKAPDGYKISLYMKEMSLQQSGGSCQQDYVKLYDGSTETATVINTFCTPNPSTFKSSGSSVLVVFISDGSVNDGSFSLKWNFFGQCGRPAIQPDVSVTRVVGGTEATPHSWPWQCIVLQGNYRCGGSVIGHSTIMTASHCFFGANGRVPDSEVTVKCGIHNRLSSSEPNAQIFTGISVTLHEDYERTRNDIALIRLPRPLTYNDYVQPVCIPSTPVADGSNCVITGWGITQDTGDDSVLRQVVIQTVNFDTCRNLDDTYQEYIKPGMLCAGTVEGGKSSCGGDSGGPLVCKQGDRWFQYGIVNYRLDSRCANPNRPTVYADVVTYQPWIREKTGVAPAERMNDRMLPTTTPRGIPMKKMSAAEKELLYLLRRKLSNEKTTLAAKPFWIENNKLKTTTASPPFEPIVELNAAEKELLALLRREIDNDKDHHKA